MFELQSETDTCIFPSLLQPVLYKLESNIFPSWSFCRFICINNENKPLTLQVPQFFLETSFLGWGKCLFLFNFIASLFDWCVTLSYWISNYIILVIAYRQHACEVFQYFEHCNNVCCFGEQILLGLLNKCKTMCNLRIDTLYTS